MSTSGSESSTPSLPSLEEVADLALGEVYIRLKDPAQAGTLPGTHLLQLALFGAKVKKENEKPVEEVKEMDVFSIVENSDLPPERKKEIIDRERKQLAERMSRLDALEDK